MTSNKCFALKGMKILSIGFFIIIIIASCNANSNSSSEDKKGTALTKPTEKIKTSREQQINK
jgi:Na+/serine symporter